MSVSLCGFFAFKPLMSGHLCLMLRLGASEAQTEPYMKYGEGVLELATPPETKSTGRIGGFADKQAGVAHVS